MKPVPVNSKLGRVGCIAGIATLVIVALIVIITIATSSGSGTTATATPTSTHAPGKIVAASTPTTAPTATDTPTIPVAAPTDTPTMAPPAQLAVTFTATSAGSISVQTSPGAALTIKVLYNCSGHYATSQSLQGTVQADSGGAYTWDWTDSSKCTGTITATVTAVLNGQTVTNRATF